MADGISIARLSDQKQLSFTFGEEGRQQLEIYTGWIDLEWSAGSHVQHRQIASFLPLSDSTDINTYDGVPVAARDITCVVSPADIQFTEDEEGLSGVDGARVVLADQFLNSVGDTRQCLVLIADLAQLNGVLHRVNYHVSVLSNFGQGPIGSAYIEPGEAPQI